jgi:hypothetical protein
MKKHIGMSNATRCKNYRKRLKAKKDLIEQQLDEHIAELRTKEKTDKTENKGIKIGSLERNSREPKEGLISQYQNESEQQFNLFGELEGIENPLDKVSHQQNLKNIFGNRAE